MQIPSDQGYEFAHLYRNAGSDDVVRQGREDETRQQANEKGKPTPTDVDGELSETLRP
jgi:hypothetical protein